MIPTKTKLWKHQVPAKSFVAGHESTLLHMGMGTGKSAVIVHQVCEAGYWRVLVLCPLSVTGVWVREFAKHADGPHKVLVLTGDGKKKAETAAKAFERQSCPLVLVVNYESAWREPFATWALKQFDWDLVVADEAHRIKAPQGKASKFAWKLGRMARRRVALTGTPMPHSPLDAFALFRFLDQDIFGTSFVKFRSRFAVVNQMFPSQVRRWINQDELAEKIGRLTFHVGAEVLDLPPEMHEERSVELSAGARRIYKELEQELIAEIGDGVVTVSNALVKLLRLQQLTGGHVTRDDGMVEQVDQAKESALRDILEDAGEPVVVFCRFRADLQTVRRVGEGLGLKVGEVSGERKDLTEHAQMPEWAEVLAVQVQSGGVGIDLTRAAIGVYYSLGFSCGEYLQSLARLNRPGQTRPCRFYHLVASGSVDEQVYRALQNKQDVVAEVVKGYSNREVQSVQAQR